MVRCHDGRAWAEGAVDVGATVYFTLFPEETLRMRASRPTSSSATAGRIFAESDECSRTFEPSKGSATIANPFDGSKDDVPGGAAYRFALEAVCKDFVADPALAFGPELVAIVEKELGRAFYEVACLRSA